MANIASLLRGSTTLLVGQASLLVAGFIHTIVLTRYLGPAEFGVWALIIAYNTLVHTFLSFRTSETLTVFWVEARLAGQRERCVLLFSSAFFVELLTKGAASAFVLCSGYMVLNWSSVAGEYGGVIVLCALARFIGFYDPVWTSIMRDRRKIASLSAVPALARWVQTALTFSLLSLWGGDLIWAGFSFLVTQLVFFVVKLALTFGTSDRLFGRGGFLTMDRRLLKSFGYLPEFWQMMRAGYISSCLSAIPKEADTLVVGFVSSEEQAGFYRVAKSLASLLLTGVQTLSTLIIQDFSELKSMKGNSGIRVFVLRYSPILLTLIVPTCILAFYLSPWAIETVYGEAYLSASVPFRILLVGTGFAAAFFWASPLLAALRHFRHMLVLQIVNFVIYCVVLGGAIYCFGAWGPAIALSVAWITGHVGALFFVWLALRNSEDEALK